MTSHANIGTTPSQSFPVRRSVHPTLSISRVCNIVVAASEACISMSGERVITRIAKDGESLSESFARVAMSSLRRFKKSPRRVLLMMRVMNTLFLLVSSS